MTSAREEIYLFIGGVPGEEREEGVVWLKRDDDIRELYEYGRRRIEANDGDGEDGGE